MRAGKDYGWPDVSYGVQYEVSAPTERRTCRSATGTAAMEGVEEPVYFWVPSIAPSGMMFYTGNLFPEWKGNLFVGSLCRRATRASGSQRRTRDFAEEKCSSISKQRIRDVRQGPDGAVYLLAGNGLLRLKPQR